MPSPRNGRGIASRPGPRRKAHMRAHGLRPLHGEQRGVACPSGRRCERARLAEFLKCAEWLRQLGPYSAAMSTAPRGPTPLAPGIPTVGRTRGSPPRHRCEDVEHPNVTQRGHTGKRWRMLVSSRAATHDVLVPPAKACGNFAPKWAREAQMRTSIGATGADVQEETDSGAAPVRGSHVHIRALKVYSRVIGRAALAPDIGLLAAAAR